MFLLTELFVMLTADSYSKMLLEKLENDLRSDQQKVNLLTLSEMYNVHYEELANVEAIRNKYNYIKSCKLKGFLYYFLLFLF